MVKLVRFLRVMLVAFGMSGTLLVVFISCNILFDCLLVVGVKAFSFLSVKKMRKYLFLPHINAYICTVNK
jgi:hypothetical protein